VLVYLSLAGLSYSMLQSVVAPALPLIAHDLGTTPSQVSWVLTGFLLAAAVLTPIVSRLGDMFGRRRVLLAVLVILGVGTAVCAAAPNLAVLVTARIVTGAAGAIIPLSIGLVRDFMPRDRVSVTVGLLSALVGIGAGVGIVMAGPVADHLGWRWLFWIPLLFVGAALAGVGYGVPDSSVRAPGRIDVLGATVLSIGLVSLLLGVNKAGSWGWTAAPTLGLTALGLVMLAGFVLVELRTEDPLLDVRILATRTVGLTNVVGLAFGFVMFSSFVLVPTLLELPESTGYGFGKSVTAAALFLLPTTLMMLVSGPVAGLLDRRYGPRFPMVLGAVSVIVAFALPALVHRDAWVLFVSGMLTGVGIGLAFAAMSNAIVESVPQTETAAAMSVNTVVRTVGGSIGTAVVASVLAAHSAGQGAPAETGFTAGFWVCTVVAVLALAAALGLPSIRRMRADAVAAGVDDLPPEPHEPHLPHLPRPHGVAG
jgi:EmrB/QacA subfamily drug resistance transporter